jgi:cytochrome P450
VIEARLSKGIDGADNDLLRHMVGVDDELTDDIGGVGVGGGGGAKVVPSQMVVDNVVTMMWAGHDTTAAALSFTAHMLAEHQDVQTRLDSELKTLKRSNGTCKFRC